MHWRLFWVLLLALGLSGCMEGEKPEPLKRGNNADVPFFNPLEKNDAKRKNARRVGTDFEAHRMADTHG